MNGHSFFATTPITFKVAQSPDEIQQILALNHRVFAQEIAQHPAHPSGLLVDRFHQRNRYFIAQSDGRVLGMISVHDGPDFSVTRRLPDPALLRDFPRPLEVRLLAIHPAARNRTLLSGLFVQVLQFAAENAFSHLLISAIAQRERMYRKLGFRPLGPAMPEGRASFLPMVMALDRPSAAQAARIALHRRRQQRTDPASPLSLMPGPVAISPRIAAAYAQPPISHRAPCFIQAWERVRSHLGNLFSNFTQPALETAIFPGGGTLANDVVAANLAAIFGSQRGLVLSNGEFGERLACQARKAGLVFDHLAHPWGEPWSTPRLRQAFAARPAWAWAVHLETSTGILNDTESLLACAAQSNTPVALDCVSSLGAAPIPGQSGEACSPLLFASAVSGKALGSYAGLAFVALSQQARHRLTHRDLCPTFDLLRMLEARGPVSTVPSSTLFALDRALEEHFLSAESTTRRHESCAALGRHTRRELRALGLTPIAPEPHAAPVITSFALPHPDFAQSCLNAGFEIAHRSGYLPPRNWAQIATMGHVAPASLAPLFSALKSGQLTHPPKT